MNGQKLPETTASEYFVIQWSEKDDNKIIKHTLTASTNNSLRKLVYKLVLQGDMI